jgi:hypothetical protein
LVSFRCASECMACIRNSPERKKPLRNNGLDRSLLYIKDCKY